MTFHPRICCEILCVLQNVRLVSMFLLRFEKETFQNHVMKLYQLTSVHCKKKMVNQSHYRPEVPRGFQEFKVPRLRDNMGVRNWKQRTQERKQWKEIIEQARTHKEL